MSEIFNQTPNRFMFKYSKLIYYAITIIFKNIHSLNLMKIQIFLSYNQYSFNYKRCYVIRILGTNSSYEHHNLICVNLRVFFYLLFNFNLLTVWHTALFIRSSNIFEFVYYIFHLSWR